MPRDLEPKEAIKRLRDQGAFISVSHPFDPHRGWQLRDLLEIIDLVDAIEVFNARCYKPEWNLQAFEFAEEHGLPGTVGSDRIRCMKSAGRGILLPAFNTADELRESDWPWAGGSRTGFTAGAPGFALCQVGEGHFPGRRKINPPTPFEGDKQFPYFDRQFFHHKGSKDSLDGGEG